MARGFESGQGVDGREDLHRTDGGQHVRIMARGRAKPSITVLAAEDELDGGLPWQCIRTTQEMKSGQPPINTVES